MSGHAKMGFIIGAAMIASTALWLYFSPLQTCIRYQDGTGDAVLDCMAVMKGRY